jgi:hypothetical protein
MVANLVKANFNEADAVHQAVDHPIDGRSFAHGER